MRIYKSPQVGADEKRFEFEFSGEVIVATFDGIEDTFDFTGLPDGEADGQTKDDPCAGSCQQPAPHRGP